MDEAIHIAKGAAAKAGYPWIEPTHVSEHGDEVHVSSNADELGGNVLVVVDRSTGKVLRIHNYLR
jgi:hypothetical protein